MFLIVGFTVVGLIYGLFVVPRAACPLDSLLLGGFTCVQVLVVCGMSGGIWLFALLFWCCCCGGVVLLAGFYAARGLEFGRVCLLVFVFVV